MLPRADITGIRPVGPIETTRPTAPVGDARQELVDRFGQAAIGKLFQAQVLSRLTDGSFAVKVSDTTVRMNLPAGMQVGDGLDLTLVAAHPRPTFLLENQAGGKADTSLSNAGKLINNVLQAAQKEGAPAALVGKTPIVPSPATSTTQVATALKDTLAFSGLFYESHVAQWANGERPLADLMREPQAKNSNPTLARTLLLANAPDAEMESAGTSSVLAQSGNTPSAAAAKPEGHAAETARQGETVRENQASSRQPAELSRLAQKSAGEPADATPAEKLATTGPARDTSSALPSSANAEAAARPETLGSESVRMISLQLEALEHRHVAWQGELWPGQQMEWEVTEEEPNRKHDDPEKSWQSVIRFELPSLGTVAASIRLTGNRLQVQVRTGNEDTASLLRAHGSELASALDAAGSPLDLLTVKRDESV